jgi:hypothetical protein
MEHESINVQMTRMAPDFAAEFATLSPIARAALALAKLAEGPSLALLHRYAARLSNEFHRSLKTLREVQKDVPLLPPGAPLPLPLTDRDQPDPELPKEPNPTSGHLETEENTSLAIPAPPVAGTGASRAAACVSDGAVVAAPDPCAADGEAECRRRSAEDRESVEPGRGDIMAPEIQV